MASLNLVWCADWQKKRPSKKYHLNIIYSSVKNKSMLISCRRVHQKNDKLSDHYCQYHMFLIILSLLGPATEAIAKKIV